MDHDRNKYKDLLVIVVGFSLIGLLIYFGYEKPYGIYFVYSALALGVVGIFSETFTTYVTKGWQHFGKLLGKINSTILLSVMFILLISPIALIKRLTTKKEEKSESSNWNDADITTIDFEKLW